MKTWFYEQAQAKGTTNFYKSLTLYDVPVEYHKYFERKWRANEEVTQNGRNRKNTAPYK